MMIMQWVAHGLPCIVLRTPTIGCLCGYVGVSPGHPLYGLDYDDGCKAFDGGTMESSLDVHGGVTFAEEGKGERPKGYWWIGFDTAHLGDATALSTDEDSRHWTGVGVAAETEKLAEQIAVL